MGFLSTFFNTPRTGEMPAPETSILEWDKAPLTHAMLPSDIQTAVGLINEAAMQTVVTYGLPIHWFSFETVTVTDKEKTYFQLQILMNHWDMQMCAHSYAFECAVIKRIRKKNSGIGRALRAVLWRVAPDAGCPFDEMPEPSYWNPQAIAQRDLLRERIQREFYAVTTPESGASVAKPGNTQLSNSKAMPLGPAPQHTEHTEHTDYSDTHAHNLQGFSLTHPHQQTRARSLHKSKNR
jgi:hypothetical protein